MKKNKMIMVNKTTRLTTGETVGTVVAGLVFGGAATIGICHMVEAACEGISHATDGISAALAARKEAKVKEAKVKEYLLKMATEENMKA